MKQLDPKSVWLFFVNYLPIWVVLFVFPTGAFTRVYTTLSALVVAVVVAVVVTYALSRFSYHFYRYELREDGFRKELGIIWKKYVTIPYDRIQNVDIHRGIVARILGLSDLNIQTAGSSVQSVRFGAFHLGAEGRLPGISKTEAEVLRDELIKRARESRITNQGI